MASLTTINTPHRGCIFADYLLEHISDAICEKVASKYNAALSLLGDSNPDFMEAVHDLTASCCRKLNTLMPDDAQVYYQSVGTKMNRAQSGRFPLNMSYPEGRGISHGDMIDLNRENIKGFDVREFYVDLVKDLKKRGL